MFDKDEMVRFAGQRDISYTEGVLDLSLPKKRQRSDSCSSHENGSSSFSASSSSSSGDAEECQSEIENVKEGSMRLHFARINSNNNDNNSSNRSAEEFDLEDRLDSSPPSDKRRKLSPQAPGELSLFSQVCRSTSGIYPDSNLNDLEVDERPIQRMDRGVSLSLHDESLWNAFRRVGTEMIINRGGRRMFPHVVLSVHGLNRSATYSIFLEIVLADDRRFKYVNEQWVGMGMADPTPRMKAVVHPDSPNLGSYWMQSRISFSKVRLTNNKDSAADNILLLSMHKYKVVIKIRNDSLQFDNISTFVFDESAFVAVTAYQNSKITQLKIQNNPFAKAFRDAPNKQKTDGIKKQNGNNLPIVDNDIQSFKNLADKKSQLPSPSKEQYESLASQRFWEPWFMAGLGSHPGTGMMPHVSDLPIPRYDGYRYPASMYINPALMAQLSYLPYLSINHQHLGQQFMRPSSLIEDTERSVLTPSSKSCENSDEDGNDDIEDTDTGSKSSNDNF